MKRLQSVLMCAASLFAAVFAATNCQAADVTHLKLPASGFRPQAVLDKAGNLHVVYAHLEKKGDLFYIKRAAKQKKFSKPIRVNSTPGCTAAFNMAVGKNGRVHVLIRPNAKYSANILKRKLKFVDLKYMLYCRLHDRGDAFETERDLSGSTFGFEGVGAVIADGKGTVHVYWHGWAKPGREPSRQIFRVVSINEGRTFTKRAAIRKAAIGACACCSMQGAIDDEGGLYLAFRNSEASRTKDSYLLTSRDGGKTFSARLLDRWPDAGCPGSTYSLAPGKSGTLVAWNTESQVFFADSADNLRAVAAPSKGRKSRAPIVVGNAKGETLFVWAEAANARQFAKGGDLAWLVYDKNGRPIGKKRIIRSAVARWSMPAAFAKPNGDFVIIYDGSGLGK